MNIPMVLRQNGFYYTPDSSKDYTPASKYICGYFVDKLLGTHRDSRPAQVTVQVAKRNPKKKGWKNVVITHSGGVVLANKCADMCVDLTQQDHFKTMGLDSNFWVRITAS
jgi:hypothetical protein